MITVKLFLEQSRISRFSVTGHAGFAEHGKDIVCAAVSAVAQTAAIGLQHYFGSAVAVEQKNGKLICDIPKLAPEDHIVAEAILMTMYWGLRDIEEQYGEHIHLRIEGGVLE
ncbi:MAG: ribosomal-processing cysteine protease Prp [Bacillota bacterium]|jgi:uncharacterized protein YsxB (DUF464 family)